MKIPSSLSGLILFIFLACNQTKTTMSEKPFTGASGEVKIMTLNPGHFHAALVQKYSYPQVDEKVHIYAPDDSELNGHIGRIERYNQRADDPTNWQTTVYTGPDYLQKMITEKPGNVVVLSGNNAKKTDYIRASIEAGLNVLADKPMAIKPADFSALKTLFPLAKEKGVLLYDIMTERYEVTTIMQKLLSQLPGLFGELEKGSPDDPAITKESVHHFFKYVSGKALIRPAWFFDTQQQGEGIVDVSTHLVDLVFWECFPEQIIDYPNDIKINSTKRWPTKLSPEQFERVTGLSKFPDYLQKDIKSDSILHTYSNGEIGFSVNDVHAKVSVIWNYQAPEGAGDTHFSIMRGTKANLIIRQGAEENFKPVLYVEPVESSDPATFEVALSEAIKKLENQYPGLSFQASGNTWKIMIPEKFKIGHEGHFAQVTEKYLQYLIDGKLPDWEVPNMLAKYYVTTSAYEISMKETN